MRLTSYLAIILMVLVLAFMVFGELKNKFQQVAGRAADQIERTNR